MIFRQLYLDSILSRKQLEIYFNERNAHYLVIIFSSGYRKGKWDDVTDDVRMLLT